MKARAVRFTPEAAGQAEAADRWWRQNRPGSGDLFANELRGATDLIARAPGTGLPEPGFARGAACGTPPVTFSGTAAQRGLQTKRTLERHVVTQAWEPTGEEYERPTQIGMALLPMTRNGSEG